ncbi:MAG: hypothetical protein ISS82_06425 [Nanoarchaeota archaeon]|nr:hypothetical protein [Nanoarchaeota archaeon]
MDFYTFKKTEGKDFEIKDLKERVNFFLNHCKYTSAENIRKFGRSMILSLNRGQSGEPFKKEPLYTPYHSPVLAITLEKFYEFSLYYGNDLSEELCEFKQWIYDRTTTHIRT